MAEREFCTVERDGRLLIVTLNRPERYNALHFPAHFELAEVWDEFAADPELWVAIVTGAGDKAFCAGNDLRFQPKAMSAGAARPALPASPTGTTSTSPSCRRQRLRDGRRVRGRACLRSDRCRRECGLRPAGAARRPDGGRRRGPPSAPDHRPEAGARHDPDWAAVGPEEGKELGFVNEVVPEGEAVAGARRWAEQILECAPISIRASKEAVYAGMNEATLEAALNRTYEEQHVLIDSADYVEGPKAFAEKRPPVWRNE